MRLVDRAVSCFTEGNNCAQAVFSTYASQFGLDQEVARKIASPFGGGMTGMGKTCGAVTGAFMVIGLKHGAEDPADEGAKTRAYHLAWKFAEKFEARNGSIVCQELLDCDISNSEGMALAREKDLFSTVCPKFVRDAAEIIEEIWLR